MEEVDQSKWQVWTDPEGHEVKTLGQLTISSAFDPHYLSYSSGESRRGKVRRKTGRDSLPQIPSS
jgi:hypothetical protein